MKKAIRVVTHYFEEDPTFISDYASVDLYVDDVLAVSYGDAYHDRGASKADGFIDGVRAVVGAENVEVVKEQVADYVG